jgi:hypothetical protein
MTYGTFPGPIFDVKLVYEVRISIYHLCHVLYSDFCDNGIIYQFSDSLDTHPTTQIPLNRTIEYIWKVWCA